VAHEPASLSLSPPCVAARGCSSFSLVMLSKLFSEIIFRKQLNVPKIIENSKNIKKYEINSCGFLYSSSIKEK
jgi:hypothetical protein